MTREAIVEKLRTEVHAGRPVVGVSAGVGLTAKCAEKGGADLIFLHNAGRFRMSGRSTLLAKFSFGNANDVTEEMVCECLPVLQSAPVVAGVFAQDPFKNVDLILERLQKLGVAGIQNSPTLGMMKPAMAKNLEAGMMGLSMEYELIRKAHDMGFFTAPIVHSAEQVQPFLDAGADVIVECDAVVGRLLRRAVVIRHRLLLLRVRYRPAPSLMVPAARFQPCGSDSCTYGATTSDLQPVTCGDASGRWRGVTIDARERGSPRGRAATG